MTIQKSFENEQEGAIYLVPTPIGNLEDITFRTLNTLRSATLIAAEDTRNTKKLLRHFEIDTPLTSYHEHTKKEKIEQLIKQAEEGAQIAVVSDAGMPGISDPGYDLVTEALKRNVKVISLPGANAALTALVASGLSTDQFYFYGFLPRKNKEKKAVLNQLKSLPATLIFYESPYRVKDTLRALQEVLGDRHITLGRELTKRFEEYIRGTLSDVISSITNRELKGEFVLVVEKNTDSGAEEAVNWWRNLGIKEHVEYYIAEKGYTSKEAIKRAALDRGLPKRTVYQHFHIGE